MDPEGELGYENDFPADQSPGFGGGNEDSIDAERGSVSIFFSEDNQGLLISGEESHSFNRDERQVKCSGRRWRPQNIQKKKSSRLVSPEQFQYSRKGRKDTPDKDSVDGRGEEEKRLKELIQDEEKEWNISEIEEVVTAKKLCSCRDPVNMAFKLNKRLKEMAETSTENTQSLENLADKVADFAFDLLDQVRTKEEIGIEDKNADRYGSMFSKMTKDAIIYGQKRFVSHPFLFKRVKMRWQKGFPFMAQGIAGAIFLLLFILLETVLTPLLLPLVAFVSYKDQVKQAKKASRDSSQKEEQVQMSEMMSPNGRDEANELSNTKTEYSCFTERYFAYLNTPKIIFMKTEVMKLVFIALHCRICVMGSSVTPSIEEYLVFLFFLAVFLSEYEQLRTSAPEIRYKMYFRDMWNWIDLLTLLTYFVIIILRVIVIIRGGDAHHNRLLEIANYCYGFNAMFLILRLSSILELSSVFGPLQLALFQMCVDLMTILVQFAFVVTAFTMALAKSYSAELSYLALNDNQPSNHTSGSKAYCSDGPFRCLYKAARQLIWSVFGLMESKDLESNSGVTSEIVGLLYLIFMILSVIMLINILVALLTTTYEKYRTNWETEWKFGLAVVEEQYQRRHCIVIPYNLLTYPILRCFSFSYTDARNENAEKRQKIEYKAYLQNHFFPEITKRYKHKYNGEFPLSVDEKLDKLLERLNMMRNEASQENEKDLQDVFAQILD